VGVASQHSTFLKFFKKEPGEKGDRPLFYKLGNVQELGGVPNFSLIIRLEFLVSLQAKRGNLISQKRKNQIILRDCHVTLFLAMTIMQDCHIIPLIAMTFSKLDKP